MKEIKYQLVDFADNVITVYDDEKFDSMNKEELINLVNKLGNELQDWRDRFLRLAKGLEP